MWKCELCKNLFNPLKKRNKRDTVPRILVMELNKCRAESCPRGLPDVWKRSCGEYKVVVLNGSLNGEQRLSVVGHRRAPERLQLPVHLLQWEDPAVWDGLQLGVLNPLSIWTSHARPLFLSQFLHKACEALMQRWQSVRVCTEEEKRCGTYFANSWRPSSRRWEVALSLAPREAMRKWTSLNMVTWSSVWGWVTWNSSRQRSFTHTPDIHTGTNTQIKLEKCIKVSHSVTHWMREI